MKDVINNIVSFFKIVINSSKSFIFLLSLNIIVSALVPFPTIVLSKEIFDILSSGGSAKEFFIVTMILVGSTILLNFLNTVLNGKVEIKGQQLMFSLNTTYNLKSINISYETLSHPDILEKRELAGKAINGSNFIDMIRSVNSIISNILILIGVTVLFIKADWIIILVVFTVILINTYANSLAKKAEYQNSIEVTPYLRKISYIQSIATGLDFGKEIRVNGLKPMLFKKTEGLHTICFGYIKKIISSLQRGVKISHVTNGVQDLVVYVILGMKVLIDKTMSIGDFTLYFNAISQFKNSLIGIISTMADMKINSLYMAHFLEYMQLPEENITKETDMIKSNSDDFTVNEITFENVSFIYPGQETYALKNVSFKIKSGEKISIVGLNGSGKTTIVKLLLRLYKPTEGSILVDSKDINDLDYESYIKYFAVVFQDFKLFAFSLRENLCANLNSNDAELNEVMAKINFEDKISSLSNGYETNYSRLFDENGVEFSGGESQKIAIARALYKNAPVVIMDEPTSALDALAEYEIYKDFNSLTSGKTAIYISHRLSSCKFCDRIIVINNGVIKEIGSHNKLLKENGIYADMYLKQAHYYIDDANEFKEGEVV